MFDLDDSLGTTLNNHKPPTYSAGGKGPGGLGGVATKRPPIHINNNLGTCTWGGTGGGIGGSGVASSGTGEKNILKGSSGARNCRNCPDDKKGLLFLLSVLLQSDFMTLDLQVLPFHAEFISLIRVVAAVNIPSNSNVIIGSC